MTGDEPKMPSQPDDKADDRWATKARMQPFDRPKAGQVLKCESLLAPLPDLPSIALEPNLGHFQGLLLQVQVIAGGAFLPHGSAVMVAPGVALTAAHTFREHLQAGGAPDFGGVCLAPSGAGLVLWRVRHLSLDEGDVAIISLDLMSEDSDLEKDGKWYLPYATLTTRQPVPGERLTIVGFRASEQEYPEGPPITAGMAMVVAQGVVTQFYPDGPGTYKKTFAVMEIDCPAIGGMSGGPVFDASGRVIGLLSSSIQGETIETGGPSYAAWIVPSLMFTYLGGWPPGLNDGACGLIHEKSGSAIEGRDAITVDEASGQWSYTGWF